MTRRRAVAAGVAAAVAGAGAVLLATRSPRVPAAGASGPTAPPPEPPPVVAAAASADEAPAPQSANQIRIGARRGAASMVAWERVPMVARVSDLGVLARQVDAGLTAARAQMDPCFEEERRLLARGVEPAYDPDDPPAGPAILVLDLESRAGAIDVVQANVETLGTSLPQLVSCAQHVLRGWPIDAPGVAPGRRWRLKHLLR